MTQQSVPPTIGAILAGGLARRLGGADKALRTVGGRSVLARLIQRLAPQVARIILNANGELERFAGYGLPVVADEVPDHPGPLAGILAALDWTHEFAPGVEWVVTVPGDAPFIPRDLVTRLHDARRSGDAVMACAASRGRAHNVVALWPVALREELRGAVVDHGVRRVELFTRQNECVVVEWPASPVDPFFNVNTLEDLDEANRLANLDP